MELDYDQLLAKQPFKDDAVFAWHQDMAYWPDTPDTRTATLWLAIDDSTIDNGCMRFVPGTVDRAGAPTARPGVRRSGQVARARYRTPRAATRSSTVPIRRGDCHGPQRAGDARLGRQPHVGFRRAYILAFRSADTIATERELGFTHSHNDAGDVIDSVAR